MTYPGASKVQVLEPSKTVKVVVQRNRPIYSRSGIHDLQALVQKYDIYFNDYGITLPDNNYTIFLQVNNYSDNEDIAPFIQARAYGTKSQNFFQVILSAPPLTGNYKLEWAIAERD